MTSDAIPINSVADDVPGQAKERVVAGDMERFSASVADAPRSKISHQSALEELERVGRRPSAEALAAARRDLGLSPADPGARRASE
jgi:hypothetical protein